MPMFWLIGFALLWRKCALGLKDKMTEPTSATLTACFTSNHDFIHKNIKWNLINASAAVSSDVLQAEKKLSWILKGSLIT